MEQISISVAARLLLKNELQVQENQNMLTDKMNTVQMIFTINFFNKVIKLLVIWISFFSEM